MDQNDDLGKEKGLGLSFTQFSVTLFFIFIFLCDIK